MKRRASIKENFDSRSSLNFSGSFSTAEVACVASVSSRGSSRKLGQEQKKKMNDGGAGGERRNRLQANPKPPTQAFLGELVSRPSPPCI